MNKNYNIYYNNSTGRVVIDKNDKQIRKNNSPERKTSIFKNDDDDFQKKIEELYKFSNLDNPNKVSIEKKKNIENIVRNQSPLRENIVRNQSPLQENIVRNQSPLRVHQKEVNLPQNNIIDKRSISPNILLQRQKDVINNNIVKKDLIYGIKKTILSDFNYLGHSSNNNNFIISLNKNINKQNSFFDSFYLFPNISEINTKSETNIINEKKVDIFKNINNDYDIQYFPIDFVACGVTVPLKSKNNPYTKLIIKNIYWNIFQSINLNDHINNDLLSLIPSKTEFIYTKIELQVNFELHAQLSKNVMEQYNNVLPYKNLNTKNITPANSCLFDVSSIYIDSLNGAHFDDIIINLIPELNINCALLCIRISVPDESAHILKGTDKNNIIFYGNIPFSQFILNFDYELC